MDDKGSLFNLALAYLGDRYYKEGTPTAQACDAVGQHCVALAFDSYPWTFATRRATLSLAGGTAELPHDCLRVLKVGASRFALFERTLHVEDFAASVELVYITNKWVQNVSVPSNEPTFAEAVALMIASKIAPRLTGNLQLGQELERKAMQALTRAKLKDAQMVDSNDQEPDNHYPLG